MNIMSIFEIVDDIRAKFKKHILTEGERYNKTIDVWTHATAEVANEMFNELIAYLFWLCFTWKCSAIQDTFNKRIYIYKYML